MNVVKLTDAASCLTTFNGFGDGAILGVGPDFFTNGSAASLLRRREMSAPRMPRFEGLRNYWFLDTQIVLAQWFPRDLLDTNLVSYVLTPSRSLEDATPPSPTAGQGDARDAYAASILGQLLTVLIASRRRGCTVGFFMLNARDVQPGVGDGVGGVIESMFFVRELIEDAEFAQHRNVLRLGGGE